MMGCRIRFVSGIGGLQPFCWAADASAYRPLGTRCRWPGRASRRMCPFAFLLSVVNSMHACAAHTRSKPANQPYVMPLYCDPARSLVYIARHLDWLPCILCRYARIWRAAFAHSFLAVARQQGSVCCDFCHCKQRPLLTPYSATTPSQRSRDCLCTL